MQIKKLPIGIQTFRDIRDPKENYVYIDKTQHAFELITKYNYVFLSRPRRFGKSLFLDTLSEIFQGNKELFNGLYIYDKWEWNEKYPVVKISFGGGSFTTLKGINSRINTIFRNISKKLKLGLSSFSEYDHGSNLEMIIHACFEKYNSKVVVLVDEYDKPILDNIANEDKEMPTQARSILRSFYSILKDNDEKIKFVFLTGVSKFSKLNLFSGLNNIQDITLKKEFATITGYTHGDVISSFTDYLEGVDLEKLKRWYNGYNYFGEPIYNPFDILLYFSDKEYKNYWWQTGNPSFLIDLLKKRPYYLPDLENKIVSEESLSAFDVEHIDIIALLWQTGYLTFDTKFEIIDRISYKMKIPNLEIQISLNTLFFEYLTDIRTNNTELRNNVALALIAGNIQSFKDEVFEMLAQIPYSNYTNNTIEVYEGYYASVMFAFLSSIGFDVIPEDRSNKGRIDMTLILPEYIYIMEFKVDLPSESAIEQIKSKKYYEKYLNSGKQIFLIGVHFSSEDRNIKEMKWEILEN